MSLSSPLRVVFLDHTAKWSGGEIALLRTLEAFDRTRVEPILVLAEEGPLAERARAVNIETHVLPLAEKLREVRKDSLGASGITGKLGTAVAFAGYANRIARFARQHKAGFLHCNSLKADIYGALAGKISRTPVIWHVRDHIDPSYLPGAAVRAFRSLSLRLPTAVITNSQSSRNALFPNGSGRMRCIVAHDGLSERELQSPPPPVFDRWKHTPVRIGIVGRFVEWKGQHIFLEAASRLTAAGVEAKYVLVGAPLFGEEEYATNLKKQAQSLGNRVQFTGFQQDVPAILRTLDILVHASITPEPFGQVVIEGMAEGLPVIASDGGGVREIIKNGVNGILTPMGDVSSLTNALITWINDPLRASEISHQGFLSVREHFTARRNSNIIENLYLDIGKPSRRRGRKDEVARG